MARIGIGGFLAGGALIGAALAVLFGGEKSAHAGPRDPDRQRPVTPPSPPGGAPAGDFFPSGVPMTVPGYSEQTWWPIIDRLIAAEFPRVNVSFARAWEHFESGGNPASVGNPGQLGQGSQEPAEIGLGQLYNPDDFRAFKLDPAAFRAYAPAAAPLAAQYNHAKADYVAAVQAGNQAAAAAAKSTMNAIARQMQTPTRALTQQEMDDQVRWTLLAKIQQGIGIADRTVATYSLSHWSVPDYWKLVKAPHALPGILNQGMPAVVKKLGRAPHSWAEFRSVLGMEHYPQWVTALNACEECGNAVAPAVA